MKENDDLVKLIQKIEVNKAYISLGERLLEENLSQDDEETVNYQLGFINNILENNKELCEIEKQSLRNNAELVSIMSKRQFEKYTAEKKAREKLSPDELIAYHQKEIAQYEKKIKWNKIFCFFPIKSTRTIAKEIEGLYETTINLIKDTIKSIERRKKIQQENLKGMHECEQMEAKIYEKIKAKNPNLDEKTLLRLTTDPEFYSYAILESLKIKYLHNPLEGEYDFLNPEELQ